MVSYVEFRYEENMSYFQLKIVEMSGKTLVVVANAGQQVELFIGAIISAP